MWQPIIFIGMHRSGTSMLWRLLGKLGLFVGVHKDRNNEALFFQQLNKWLMTQCGARWDVPLAMHYLWENEELLTWIEDYVRYLINSPRAIQFLGLRRYLTNGRITQLNMPWGWKDPRNTFTLPMWLRIFPDAKVVYIERHGVDVAQSLRVRSRKGFVTKTMKYRKCRPIVSLRPKRGGFIESPRCVSLEGGFSLWQEYTDQATEMMRQLPNHRVLKLRYEQVLEDPVLHLRVSAEFCGIDVSNQKLETMAAGINGSSAYSYLNDPELRDFARDHQVALTDKGYD
jgi:Sulfotransferase family